MPDNLTCEFGCPYESLVVEVQPTPQFFSIQWFYRHLKLLFSAPWPSIVGSGSGFLWSHRRTRLKTLKRCLTGSRALYLCFIFYQKWTRLLMKELYHLAIQFATIRMAKLCIFLDTSKCRSPVEPATLQVMSDNLPAHLTDLLIYIQHFFGYSYQTLDKTRAYFSANYSKTWKNLSYHLVIADQPYVYKVN